LMIILSTGITFRKETNKLKTQYKIDDKYQYTNAFYKAKVQEAGFKAYMKCIEANGRPQVGLILALEEEIEDTLVVTATFGTASVTSQKPVA